MNLAGARPRVGALLLLLAACTPDPSASATTDRAADQSAARIVALSPHLTELAFAAGAGAKLVGVVEFSNHPVAAQALPRVGDAFRLDLEALAAARPDLILGWPSGNSPRTLDRLRRLGYRVVDFEPRTLDDLGVQIEAIGALAGTEAAARPADIAPIELMQMVQRKAEEIDVRLVMARHLTESEKERLTSFIWKNLGHNFQLRFEYVDTLRNPNNGKIEQFISLL